MLQSFSDRIRTSRWLGYAIVIAISIPFALWGIQAYMGGGDPGVAARVNGKPIKNFEVERGVSQQRRALAQRFGGDLPDAFSDQMLRQRVLDNLITREVLRQAADDAGMRIRDQRVAAQIRRQQYFQSDGAFDPELYRKTLSQAGLSPQQYEAQVREGVRLEQLRSGIADTAFVLPGEAREAARLQGEERRVAVLERGRAAVASSVSVDDDAVQAYYDKHKDAFQTPRRVRVAYLDLDIDALRKQVDVSEDELRAEYRANRDQYRQQEERKAAHILIRIPDDAQGDAEQAALAKAQRIRQRLKDGGDFGALAREYSDDSGSAEQGGELGYVGRGDMVEPFEKALFGLDKVGAVSDPVRTSYGYHLIKLEDIRAPKPKPFDEVRDELRRKLATQRAERLFYDRVEVLSNTAYENPGSLQPAAKASGLEIERTDWFSRNKGTGIADNAAVRKAAFSSEVLQERRNSDVVELDDRHVVILRVVDEQPPSVRPLDEVRDAVRERLESQRVSERLKEWSKNMTSRLDEGAAPGDLAGEGTQFRDLGWIGRDAGNESDEKVDPVVRRVAFELPIPGQDEGSTYSTATLADGGMAVVLVRTTRLPDPDEEAVSAMRQQRRNGISGNELQAWIAALRDVAEIERTDSASGTGGG